MENQQKAKRILDQLAQTYPAQSALNYRNPFQLLVAAVLSAQSTDVQVNRASGALFEAYPDAESLARATPEQIQKLIKGVGLYRNKSFQLVAAAQMLQQRFGGEVPRTREDLLLLPGVGRKTANVVLSNAFGIPALGVDTHVLRVSNRLGLAQSHRVLETEKQLTATIPRELWGKAHHWLIWHGRKVCRARFPRCGECGLAEWCDYYQRCRGKQQ